MAKYFRSSFYYPDDKDIYDFLDSTSAPADSMLSFLRAQGIFAANGEKREHLCDYISLYYLSWHSAEQLVNTVNVRDSDDYKTNDNFAWKGDFASIQNALNSVEERRKDRERERYTIDGSSNKYVIAVKYIDVETGRTRLLQEREKAMVLEIQKTPEGFKVRYDDVPRAHQILQDVIAELTEERKEEKDNAITASSVNLANITTASGRVSFFKKMMDGVDGAKLQEVIQIRIERLSHQQVKDDEEEESVPEEELDEAIRRVVLYGTGLWDAPDFKALIKKRFYVSYATWRSELATSAREHVEMCAGFNEPKECRGFHYKVNGIFKRDDEGLLKTARERAGLDVQKQFREAIENAAQEALSQVTKEQESAK